MPAGYWASGGVALCPCINRVISRRAKTYFYFTQLRNHQIVELKSEVDVGAWRRLCSLRMANYPGRMLASRAVMVTLKSLSSYDILPEIDAAKIAEAYRPQVAQAIERVLDSAFRESPISVIDHCRDALAVVLARWMTQNGGDPKTLLDDLAKLAGAVEKAPHDKVCAGNMGRVVALLHNRGKTNQQISNGWRAPVEEDAAMAVQALGFTLRELGWAKDTSFPAHP